MGGDVLALVALLTGALLALSGGRGFAVALALWCLGQFWCFRRPNDYLILHHAPGPLVFFRLLLFLLVFLFFLLLGLDDGRRGQRGQLLVHRPQLQTSE